MKHLNLAFLGFGHVNQALAALLLEKQVDLAVKTYLLSPLQGLLLVITALQLILLELI